MSAIEIIKMGNPLLREVAEKFSVEEIKSPDTGLLLEDMWDSLEAAGGIGLAAPQIGISKQLAIIKLSEDSDRYPDMEDSEAFVIFNPEITWFNLKSSDLKIKSNDDSGFVYLPPQKEVESE